LAEKYDATATAGSAYFCGARPVSLRCRDQPLDARRCDPRMIFLTSFPILPEQPRHPTPVLFFECRAHVSSDGGDGIEFRNHAALAVDVSLHDFPIVDSGIA